MTLQAARANRIRSLAAGWGYGSKEECAQADAFAATPEDLPALVAPQLEKAEADVGIPNYRSILSIRSKMRSLASILQIITPTAHNGRRVKSGLCLATDH